MYTDLIEYDGNKEINLDKFESISQVERHPEKTSDRYAFVSTMNVVEVLRDSGWGPVYAKQSRSKTHGGFQKHIIRFRSQSDMRLLEVGEEIPEIVLSNCHMGTASFELDAGVFRCICSNQARVAESTIAKHKIRHVGYAAYKVEDALKTLESSLPVVMDRIENFKSTSLNSDEREILAKAAGELRFDSEKQRVTPSDLLRPRRYSGDNSKDLWTTFNVIQENVIRGGIYTRNNKGKRTRSRAVTSIEKDEKLNKALWVLTEEFHKLKNS